MSSNDNIGKRILEIPLATIGNTSGKQTTFTPNVWWSDGCEETNTGRRQTYSSLLHFHVLLYSERNVPTSNASFVGQYALAGVTSNINKFTPVSSIDEV